MKNILIVWNLYQMSVDPLTENSETLAVEHGLGDIFNQR